MKIVIAGGTGFIGRPLCEYLLQNDSQVTVLARFPHQARYILPPTATIVWWDGLNRGPWERALEGADAVINLAGEPVADARWTAERKQGLRDSRINSTRLLVQAIWNLPHRPSTLINASAIGYYGPRDAVPVNEQTRPGRGFLADLCVDWEREAVKAEAFGLRVVRLRIGMVLGDGGGALPRMVPPFRFFLGGPIMPGDQWVSWIHRHDLISMIDWALESPTVRGPLNGRRAGRSHDAGLLPDAGARHQQAVLASGSRVRPPACARRTCFAPDDRPTRGAVRRTPRRVHIPVQPPGARARGNPRRSFEGTSNQQRADRVTAWFRPIAKGECW